MKATTLAPVQPASPAQAALLALLFLAVHVRGADWGMPSFAGWIPDEILPGDVVGGLEAGFGDGWHERYPPLHYYVLAVLDSLFMWAQGVPARNPLPLGAYGQMALIGRGLSLLMGAGTAVLVYLVGCRLYGRLAGILAAIVVTGIPTLGFHTRLATLDLPYLFWWMLSLLFALRALEHPRRTHLLGFGLAAALAVTTKDQAYALYLMAWPAWLLLLRARRAGSEPTRPLSSSDVALPLGLAALVFALVHRLPGNTDGFLAHVDLILGQASQPFRMFPRTLAGELRLAQETTRQVAATLGLPAFGLGLAGLAWLGLRRPLSRGELYLLASGASYYLTFLCVVLYSYDRFVLPLSLLLALFGAGALAALARRGAAARRLALAIAIGLAAHGLARALALGRLMACDTRYAAERWLHERVRPGDRLAFVGRWKDLPRPEGFSGRSLPADVELLQGLQPRYVVYNVERAALVQAGDVEAPFFRELTSGRLGYALVWRWRAPVGWPLGADLDALADWSNLPWINPGIAIYERVDAGTHRQGRGGGERKGSAKVRGGPRGRALRKPAGRLPPAGALN